MNKQTDRQRTDGYTERYKNTNIGRQTDSLNGCRQRGKDAGTQRMDICIKSQLNLMKLNPHTRVKRTTIKNRWGYTIHIKIFSKFAKPVIKNQSLTLIFTSLIKFIAFPQEKISSAKLSKNNGTAFFDSFIWNPWVQKCLSITEKNNKNHFIWKGKKIR